MSVRTLIALSAMPLGFALLLGCGGAPAPTAPATSAVTDVDAGWWCGEHGVPEEVCALCSPKLAANFKADGDWCAEHERPESQCFVCNPEKQAEFAAQYEAKYGELPPPLEAHEEGHEHDEHEHET